MEKLVSVIMPVYNDSKFVKEAINSILNQTYKNKEMIVVDDGSDDQNTVEVLTSFGDKIKYYRLTENSGVAAALNFGLEHVSGEFIARMDADDVAMPERLQKQIKFFEDHPDIDVLGTECEVIDENGEIAGKMPLGYYSDSEIKAKLIFENSLIHPTIMMRRALIDSGWRYDKAYYAEDLDLWTRMASKGIKFANLSDPLLRYRRCSGQMSAVQNKIAPSAAESAKKYVETMFLIDEGKYKTEYFTRPYYKFLIQSSYAEFVRKSCFLLCEIYESNQKTRKIEEKDLIKELNARWNWIIGDYCSRVTVFGDFREYLVSDKDADSDFFIQTLEKRFDTSNINQILDTLERRLTEGEKQANDFFCQSKTVVIYGMGKRGMRVLKSFLEKREQGQTSWELLGVSDKNEISFKCDGRNYHTVSQDELKCLNPDLVLITSAIYFDEMKNELIQKGLEASRLINCNWLL